MKSHIHILPAHKIDRSLWDACVNQHSNGLIYAHYNYLEAVCDQWNGLIIGDYEAVMPLPWRKKWFLKYYYIPPFIQQLGLIGSINLPATMTKGLFQAVRNFAWYGDIHFNFANQNLVQGLKYKERSNYIIDLHQPYSLTEKQYSRDLRQILERPSNASFNYEKHNSYSDTIHLYQDIYGDRMPHISGNDFNNLIHLCKRWDEDSKYMVRAVTGSTGNILSCSLMFQDNKRIYHLINATIPEGRKMHSNHWLIDQIIREFSGQPLLFDFEGSDLPGVKTFYKKFGGIVQPYFHYRRNILL